MRAQLFGFSISAMNQRLDASLARFAGRPLAEAFPYLILDARYERVREAGVIVSQAVLIAIGIDWDGRRQSLPQRKPGFWRSSSPTATADQAGGISCSGSRRVVCTASNSSSPMITPVSGRHCARLSRKRPISAATCISSGTRSTTCRAGSTTFACKSCAGYLTAAISPRPVAIWPPGSPNGCGKYPKLTGWAAQRTSTKR